MQKVTVNGRAGHVTSILSTKNNKYNVWFEGAAKAEYIDAKEVIFEDTITMHINDDRIKALKKAFDGAGIESK